MSKYSEVITRKTGNIQRKIQMDNNTCLGNGYLVEKLIENRKNSSIYCVKKEGQSYIAKVYTKKENRNEIAQVVQSISSQYVMPIIHFGEYGEYYYEIYPAITYPTLAKIGKFDIEDLKLIINGINEGLKALHINGITHGDIKPDNIFWNALEKNIIISDFESAALEKDGYVMFSNSGTNEYEPPCDVLNGQLVKKPGYDYGSFGVLCLDLYNGSVHFAGKTLGNRVAEWKNGIAIAESCPSEFVRLIRGLTSYSEDERFQYEQVKKWFDDNFSMTQSVTRIPITNIKPLQKCTTVQEDNGDDDLEELLRLLVELEEEEDLQAVFATISIDDFYQEYINSIKDGSLQEKLKKTDNKETAEILDSLLLESYGEDDFLYYLIKFVFGGENVALELGKDNIFTVEELCKHIQENGFSYIEENHNYAKVCAWLYVRGYAKDIKDMREWLDKNE